MLVGNSKAILRLQDGKLRKGKQPVIKTCVKYRDGKGKMRYKGTPELRSTQFLAFTNNGHFSSSTVL